MICPLDFRYGRDKVKNIFSEEEKFQSMLKVEMALINAYYKLGLVSKEDRDLVKNAIPNVKVSRIAELEEQTKHDVMAMVLALSEQAGSGGRFVHLGATSNDIIDTATALQLKRFTAVLEEDISSLEDVLIRLSESHKNTIMLGRTHGQHALPITFGLKLSVYLAEIHRHFIRLLESRKRVLVGKMMGAVGTGAGFEPYGTKVQEHVMQELELGFEEGPTQIVGRDRYIEFIDIIANIATTLEKIGTEIRNLQRPEIAEVSEYFDVKKQIGSSTMAHKRNPIISENICSLARIVRGFVTPMHESAVLWHERDLTNSAAERFVIPHTCILIDDILVKTKKVLGTLIINKENMLKNLESAKKLVMDESLIVTLTKKGMPRQEAHELIRVAAITATEQNKNFDEILVNNQKLKNYLSTAELQKLIDPFSYLGQTEQIIDNIISKIKTDRKVFNMN